MAGAQFGQGRGKARKTLPRRALLGAGGAVLALPWLEALAPRTARGQAVEPPRRFLPISFPCGVPDFWWPAAAGAGSDFQLTSVLAPFAPIKERLLLLGGVENGSAFNADGGPSVEPSHGRLSGGFLTCVDGRQLARDMNLPVGDINGISVDQVLAQTRADDTPLGSWQLGLSTTNSFCDGMPCSYSRSISWADTHTPLYKTVDPQLAFEQLFGPMGAAPARGSSRDKSVIDAVLASSKALDGKLSAQDRQTLDRYLTSLRQVEQDLRVDCDVPQRPMFSAHYGLANGQEGYDRGIHFDVMNRLIALAFQCDLTRVISYMLDDERSEFVFDNLEERTFTLTSSAPNGSRCTEWHAGGQNGPPEKTWSTIQWWHNQKVTELCQLLAELPEGDGNVLDNTVVFYGSCMHGADHYAKNLPIALIASPKVLRTDRYHVFGGPCALRDLYFTLLNGAFGLNVPSFGNNLTGAPQRLLTEVLA